MENFGVNDELDLDALMQVTGGRNYLTPEEEASIYKNFSGGNASAMVDLLNTKKALDEIKKEDLKENIGGRNI